MYFLKPLSTEEELIVLEQYFNGNEEERKTAKNKLIEHNLRLVAHFAKRYFDSSQQNFQYDYEELISIGIIGLIKGINTFSADKKTKLSTYAGRCIENELRMYLRSKKKHNNNISLDESQSSDADGNEVSMLDKLIDEHVDVENDVITKMQIVKLNEIFENVLTEKEIFVIKKRYGIECIEETQQEIADTLNISRSYVSRIEKKALSKLKKALMQ